MDNNEELTLLCYKNYEMWKEKEVINKAMYCLEREVRIYLRENYDFGIGTLIRLTADVIKNEECFTYCKEGDYAIVSDIVILIGNPEPGVNLFSGGSGGIFGIPLSIVLPLVCKGI